MNINGEDFKYLASGSNRKTFVNDSKTVVAKIPLSESDEDRLFGIGGHVGDLNALEEESDPPMAYCELLPSDKSVLLMEYVEPLDEEKQIGRTNDGRIVRYDN